MTEIKSVAGPSANLSALAAKFAETAQTPKARNWGLGIAFLLATTAGGVTACGQKPAPAAEAPQPGKPRDDVPAMRVTQVSTSELAGEFSASGRLVVREEAAVGVELSGFRVASVLVDEGDWVKQGQAMARLDDTLLQAQIAQAKATVAQQRANAEFKKNQLDRANSLGEAGALSKETVEQRRTEAASADASVMAAEAALKEMEARESRMTIRAPVSGRVLQRSIRPGEISSPATQTPYFRIARDGLVELDAEVSDGRLSQIKEGEPATVRLPTGETFQGKVRFISPRVEQTTGLGKVRIALPYNEVLRPGSFAEATLQGQSGSTPSVIASAVRYESGGPSLMVVDKNNTVHKQPVSLGARVGDRVEIVQGPPAGTSVLAVGTAYVLDGDVIRPVSSDAAATPTASAKPDVELTGKATKPSSSQN